MSGVNVTEGTTVKQKKAADKSVVLSNPVGQNFKDDDFVTFTDTSKVQYTTQTFFEVNVIRAESQNVIVLDIEEQELQDLKGMELEGDEAILPHTTVTEVDPAGKKITLSQNLQGPLTSSKLFYFDALAVVADLGFQKIVRQGREPDVSDTDMSLIIRLLDCCAISDTLESRRLRYSANGFQYGNKNCSWTASEPDVMERPIDLCINTVTSEFTTLANKLDLPAVLLGYKHVYVQEFMEKESLKVLFELRKPGEIPYVDLNTCSLFLRSFLCGTF